MKLSAHIVEIERAYTDILQDMQQSHHHDHVTFTYTPRRPNHIIPRNRDYHRPPALPTLYEPDILYTPIECKEKLVLLGAFQATYHDSKTPISPDMVPLIIDTGASISISPYRTDFISPIRPVQQVQIKGIASGLDVAGIGDLQYTIYNDQG
jgi:hypothetical protein